MRTLTKAEEDTALDRVTIREILVPTDLRPRASAAYAQAAQLGERLGAYVTLYHALGSPGRGTASDDVRAAADTATARFKSATTANCHFAAIVEPTDDPCAAVLGRLDAAPPDLVVLPVHGHEGPLPFHARTISELLLQRARCPVLCVRAGAPEADQPYRRILVPCDLSGDSKRALPIVRLLARVFEAEVIGLFVMVPSPSDPFGGVSVAYSGLVPAQNAARDFFTEAGLGTQVEVREGIPSEQILDAAREEAADLIVLSSHRHDSLLDRILGSHAERIVRQATCPVLVV